MKANKLFKQTPYILAIDTSCDETSVAVTHGEEVCSNTIHSQLDLHKAYGGVVPSIARLEHEKKLPAVIYDALSSANITSQEIDAIAVTQGPGLAIALEVGIAHAKKLAKENQKPLLAVDHMVGHLFSWITPGTLSEVNLPAVGLLVSGGHTELILVGEGFTLQRIGETFDDACGEAFDKFATMIGVGYPGGPEVSRLAAAGRNAGLLNAQLVRDHSTLYAVGLDPQTGEEQMRLPLPMAFSNDLNLSYSGLKTAVKQLINKLSNTSDNAGIKQTGENSNLTEEEMQKLCVIFEYAALQILLLKLEQALIKHADVKEIWLGGGVAASLQFRSLVKALGERRGVRVRYASDTKLLTDNAAMIGLAAYVLGINSEETKNSTGGKFLYLPSELDLLERQPNRKI